jgi:hypothetical protein
MSMEQSPEPHGPLLRRGPSVDLDPSGIATGTARDRERRQLLNDSFDHAAIRRSWLGAYLIQAHSFLSMPRRSPYVNKSKNPSEGVELLPGQGRFLFANVD